MTNPELIEKFQELAYKCEQMSFLLGLATAIIIDTTKYVCLDEAQQQSVTSLLQRIDNLYYKDDKNVPERGRNPSDTPVCRANGDNEGENNPA